MNETIVVGVQYLEEKELQPVKVQLRFNEGKASVMITRAVRYGTGTWTFEEASAVMFFSNEEDETSARGWANGVMKQELS